MFWKVLRAALCPLARGIYEGEEGPTGKVVAISTSGTLGVSVILQHRVNESCEDVKRPDSGRVFERKIFEILAFSQTVHALCPSNLPLLPLTRASVRAV